MNGELPEGWTAAAIGDIAVINPRHPRTVKDSTIVSFARMAAVSESRPDFNHLDQRPLGQVRQGFTHFADGDVLFAKITPCMENGKGAVASGLSNGLGCGTTELIVIRPQGEIDPHYLYRFLSQPWVRAVAKEHFTSSAGQARVPTSFIEELEIPIAPICEQRRIVSMLEILIAKVNRNVQRLDCVRNLLNRFRQSVLAAACSGRLTTDWRESVGLLPAAIPTPPTKVGQARRRGANLSGPADLLIDEMPEIPSSWRYVRQDWLAAPGTVITYGIVLPGPEIPHGVPYVRQQDIQDGWIRTDELRHTTKAIAARHPRSSLAAGDVLLCIIRNLRVAIVPESLNGANITQGAVRIRPDTRYINAEYLSLYLASGGAQGWMRRRYFGMDMPRINVEDARAVPIALPPMQEQLEIVRRAKDLLTISGYVERRVDTAAIALERLTKSLLATAFRGELVPTEAELAARERREYEPASVLLDRIATGDGRRDKVTPARKSSRVSQTVTKKISSLVGASPSRRRQHDVA
jgi:type I restriction enzyme, S subunit